MLFYLFLIVHNNFFLDSRMFGFVLPFFCNKFYENLYKITDESLVNIRDLVIKPLLESFYNLRVYMYTYSIGKENFIKDKN